MEENFYCIIHSEKSRDLFPDNTAAHFRVALPRILNFSRDYECALMDFSYTAKFPDKRPLREAFICLNIAAEQLTGTDRRCSLLRYTTLKKGKFYMETFPVPYYIPVKPIRTNILEVYIKDEDGTISSFIQGKTTCTLHFRKKSII